MFLTFKIDNQLSKAQALENPFLTLKITKPRLAKESIPWDASYGLDAQTLEALNLA